MLLRSGDLTGFARRLWRRLRVLWKSLEGQDSPVDHEEWRKRWVDLTARDREVVARWTSATRFAVAGGVAGRGVAAGTAADDHKSCWSHGESGYREKPDRSPGGQTASEASSKLVDVS